MSIYKLTPDQLRAEIAAVESRENETYAAVLRKQAIADAISDYEIEKKKQANWDADQLHTAFDLQGDRKGDLMSLLDKAESKKAKKKSDTKNGNGNTEKMKTNEEMENSQRGR